MATSAQDLWWESCFSNSTAIASTLARKTQRKWCWSWRAGTSTKQAIPLFFALMHRSEKNETAFPPQRRRRNEPSLIWPPVETSRLADHFYCRNFVAWGHYIVAACGTLSKSRDRPRLWSWPSLSRNAELYAKNTIGILSHAWRSAALQSYDTA